MSFFRRSDKTQRIGSLETAIAKLAGEMMQIKAIAEKTQEGVEDIQKTMGSNHVEHTRCEGMQDGRWKEHLAEHRAIQENLEKLTKTVQRLVQDVRILSASITRIGDQRRDADRQRDT